jgi:cell division protein FtsQ
MPDFDDSRPASSAIAREARRGTRPSGEDDLSARVLDLDSEEESPFLRAQKRVAIRRGPLPAKAANRLRRFLLAGAVVAAAGALGSAAYFYATHSWRFRIDSSDHLAVEGIANVPYAQVLEVFGADIGRNIFFVPLAERKKQLEEIPWVESAAVMRLLPNHLKVQVRERTPVAFVRISSKVLLIDPSGVLLELPARSSKKYSFPLITGMQESEPLSTRAARMKIYSRLVDALDAGGAGYSRYISEVELSDPEDVKLTVSDPDGAVLVHLGDEQFLDRYRTYLAHVQEWRQQFGKVESVDLRYDRQVIVNPDSKATHSVPLARKASQSRAAPVRRRAGQ